MIEASRKQFSKLVLMINDFLTDKFNVGLTDDYFLYGLSTLPQFGIAFRGNKDAFRKNMNSVVNTEMKNTAPKNKDKSMVYIDNDFWDGAVALALQISQLRVSEFKAGDTKVVIGDILLACLENEFSDFPEYVRIANGNPEDFINQIYLSEGVKFSVENYYSLVEEAADPFEYEEYDEDDFDDEGGQLIQMSFGGFLPARGPQSQAQKQKKKADKWKQFCTDLCEEVKSNDKPLVGREKELAETIRILCRKEKANPIHLGEAGVGKTEITLALARKINKGEVPERIKGAKLFSLDLGGMMAGTSYRGEMEEKLKNMKDGLEALAKDGMVILYIDEIHMICGAGESTGSSMDVANIIKPMLTKSNIRVIGATTPDEYKKYIEKDKALARRFKPVNVVEPSPEEAKEILKGILPVYAEYHHVEYEKDVVDTVVDLTVKYVHDKRLPDKAIDIIDEAGASISQNYKEGDTNGTVTKGMVEHIIAESYKIPVAKVETDDITKLKALQNNVLKNVYGQDEAVIECINAIKMSRLGLIEGNKPIANLLFVGQTGVGKTEVAVQIAKALDIELVRFDMSEYSDEISVNKLIGSAAGYVGYDDGGLLVEKIRNTPHCVLLLDEIEKAHSKVFDVLLQVMDNASLSDNKGRQADFKNVIIIMTSNAGARNIVKNSLGFGGKSQTVDYSAMDRAVKETFSPEFRNRLTKIVKFNSMTEEMARRIVVRNLNSFVRLLAKKGITATYDEEVVDYIKEKGITPEFGGREIIRVINTDLKMLFVDFLMDNKGKKVRIAKAGDKLTLTIPKKANRFKHKSTTPETAKVSEGVSESTD